MKAQKFYFKNEDSEMCYPLSHHIEEAKMDDIAEIELIEAIPDFKNHEFIWCTLWEAVGENPECNNDCPDYEFVRGKGCKHKGRLYEHGDSVRFNVESSKIVN